MSSITQGKVGIGIKVPENVFKKSEESTSSSESPSVVAMSPFA
jgi:hypothetical protein